MKSLIRKTVSFSLANIDCHIYIDGKPKVIFYWGTAKGHTDIDKVISLVSEVGGKDYILCAYEVNDWNSDFSPWEAPPVFGKEGFSGNGNDTLTFLNEILIPYIEKNYPESLQTTKIIAGYSLAGLFSLWAALNGYFKNAISCSGSLWFPNWLDFLSSLSLPQPESSFYLSLGDKETQTKNKILKTVGNNTLATVEYLSKNASCKFEWNEGTHFDNSEERMAKAFSYFLSH